MVNHLLLGFNPFDWDFLLLVSYPYRGRKLDLTDNFFNGVLSASAGKLHELEEIRLDVNQVYVLRSFKLVFFLPVQNEITLHLSLSYIHA